jgi:hypothetical protein
LSDLQSARIAHEAAAKVYGLLKNANGAALFRVRERRSERERACHACLARDVHHMKSAANRLPKKHVAKRGGRHE